MKVLQAHSTFHTPAYNAQTPARHILAFSPTQFTVYSRYAQEINIQNHIISPEQLLHDAVQPILSSITPHASLEPRVLYFGSKAVLIPESYYSENNTNDLIHGAFDVLPHETLLTQRIAPNLLQLFAIPTQIYRNTEKALGACTWAHSAGVLIPAYQHEAKQHAHDTVFLYLGHGMAAFTLFNQQQLQQQHLQPFTHPNDLLYTLLHLNAHLSNPQEPRALFVHGEWDGLSDFMHMLQTKNWPVKPFTHPDASLLPSLPNTAFLPLHQVYSTCVS